MSHPLVGSEADLRSHRWALIVGHPGHELRAFHFCERTRPLIAVITDGSGSTGVPRLSETADLARHVGADPATVFGALTDRQAYALLQSGDAIRFLNLVTSLAQNLLMHGATAVVTDAAEGYNPVHDICRALAEAAVRQSGRPIVLFELDLAGAPDGDGEGIRLSLDADAFHRKLEAARRYSALAGEAAAALEQYGVDAFRVEFLRRASAFQLPPPDHKPYYERVGEERVRQGRYTSVLRYGDHVRPILDAVLTGCPASANATAGDPLH